MPRFGYALSAEEHPPDVLVRNARAAAEAGFEAVPVMDTTRAREELGWTPRFHVGLRQGSGAGHPAALH